MGAGSGNGEHSKHMEVVKEEGIVKIGKLIGETA
jgi:hypothetical protein